MAKSKKPGKARKRFFESRLHELQKQCSAPVAKELRKEIGKRTIIVKEGDKAKVERGAHKGHEGKVTEVNYRKNFVFIEKLVRKKADGKEVPLRIRPSNIIIVETDSKDRKRFKEKKESKVKKKKE
ncbi:MAG: 50S ribosomal protein L24 [Candidatus Diapherotrites archaeon]|nr:50S ribosomal protein L24 [Candidatus Diapherotrites archaeon]